MYRTYLLTILFLLFAYAPAVVAQQTGGAVSPQADSAGGTGTVSPTPSHSSNAPRSSGASQPAQDSQAESTGQGSRLAQAEGPSGSGSGSTAPNLPRYFYKRLTGTIDGKQRIVMNLTRMGGRLVGDLYYVNGGTPLFFGYNSTITKDGKVHLVVMNEVDIAGAKSTQGVFDGRFVGRNALEGTWKGSSHGSSLPFAVSTVGIGDGPFDMVHDERSYDAQSHGSAQITFTYPVMRSDSAETDSAFNENIYSAVVGMYENGVNSVAPTSVHQAMNDFIHSFRAQIGQPNSFAYYPPWSYSITGQVLFNADGIVSIRYESFSFEGGAHPNTVYTNESYDRSSGSVIRLDDLLKPGTRQQLNAIGLKAFRREHGIAPGQTLQQAGYFVSDQNFSLDSNFLVTRAGLLFQFNQYQIAPYSFGAQQVLVPYAEIRPLLLATSPISSMAFAAQGATP